MGSESLPDCKYGRLSFVSLVIVIGEAVSQGGAHVEEYVGRRRVSPINSLLS
jgi:hypothetical protein